MSDICVKSPGDKLMVWLDGQVEREKGSKSLETVKAYVGSKEDGQNAQIKCGRGSEE